MKIQILLLRLSFQFLKHLIAPKGLNHNWKIIKLFKEKMKISITAL
jgi:hypothetical protein